MKRWSKEEVDILIENYNKVSNEKLMELLPTKTSLAIYKKAVSLGMKKSKEIEFLNRSIARRREKGSKWNGGKRKTSNGYIQVLQPDHPRADSAGYVMEHIVVFEKITGISVPKNCCIHHLNGIKSDNRIENLCMMGIGPHSTFHNLKRKAVKKYE